jgi:hypothetical protein
MRRSLIKRETGLFFEDPSRLDQQTEESEAPRVCFFGDGFLPPTTKYSPNRFGWYQASLDVFVNSYMLCRGSPEVLLLNPCPEVPVSVPRHVAAMPYVRAEALKCGAYLRNQVRSLLGFSCDECSLLNNLAALLQDRGRRGACLDVYDLARLQEMQRIFEPDPGPEPDEFTRMFAAAAPVPTLSTALESEWGWMTLHTPLLSATRSLRSRGRGQRPGGVRAFRYPHRAWLPVSDGRAFGQRLPTASDLRRILSHFAGMTVGIYASDPDSLRSGGSVISAKNGKTLSDPRFQGLFGSGNVVDGPALRWLLRQWPPRFWVSDGCVTGMDDKVAANLSAEARRWSGGGPCAGLLPLTRCWQTGIRRRNPQ